jgi:serine/threonine-protein kinase
MLLHPNIVKIFDVSVKGNQKYFVMERIEGITLKSYMQKKGALSTEEILSYSEQVLKALDHAHTKGIVHRDIKPQNILLLRNGRVKVTDFGIATLSEGDMVPSGDKAIGTVYYISPEQANGKEVDHRSDLYSLGVMMYEMATGSLPFNAETPVSVALKQVRETPKPPSELQPDIPVGLEQIILGAMEKNPDRRFRHAEQMLRYVEKLRDNNDLVFKIRRNPAEENEANDNSEDGMNKKKKKKPRRKRRESSSMFPIIFGVTVAFIIVFVTSAITILDLVMRDQSLNASVSVEVPDVLGDIYGDDMEDLFDPAYFTVEIVQSYNSSVPKNTVVKQEPEGGALRKLSGNKKVSVILTISMGTEMVMLPDFSMTEYRKVGQAIESLNLKYVYREVANPSVEIGYVLYTEPAAKSLVEKGSTVTVYYSAGSKIERISVPVLTNLTPLQAYDKIGGNFRVDYDNITREYSDTVPEGYIISQSLPANTEAIKGTYISFVISLGPDPNATTPETNGPPETVSPIDNVAP